MKKYICILASAALLVACEQKTETVAPAASPADATENNTTVVNPPSTTINPDTTTHNNTTVTAPVESTPMATMTPATSEGSTMESTMTTEASPTP